MSSTSSNEVTGSSKSLSADSATTATHIENPMEEGPLRYLAYGARLKTAIVAGARYLAYTSDVGEAFRPIVHPVIVKAAYGISWLYVLSDVAISTYNEKQKETSTTGTVLRTATKTAIFQSTASMILPMITIHQTVHLTAKLLSRFGNKSKVIPTICGLAVVPALPFMFDHPVEHVVDTVYDKYWPIHSEEKVKEH